MYVAQRLPSQLFGKSRHGAIDSSPSRSVSRRAVVVMNDGAEWRLQKRYLPCGDLWSSSTPTLLLTPHPRPYLWYECWFLGASTLTSTNEGSLQCVPR